MPPLNDHQLVLDRIEDADLAHLENGAGQQIILPATWLPTNAREGHVLDATVAPGEAGASSVTLTVNEAATTARREEMAALRASLEKGPEGDVEL